jgi:uncharacterized protein DUF4386
VKKIDTVSSGAEQSQIKYARLAGFLYLLDNAAYAAGLIIISRFSVPENFAETARRILQSELFYRLGLTSLLVGAICTVFLAMALYVSVKPVDGNLALLALAFRIVEAAIFGVMSIFSFSALKLYLDANYARAFDVNQLSVLTNLSSVAAWAGFNIASLFFSMGSILFFYLFLKAKYIPRILSSLGLFGSVLMAAVCFASLLFPRHARTLQLGWIPIGLAEITTGFWLLFKGINVRHSGAPSY